jgi:hypothetical protein
MMHLINSQNDYYMETEGVCTKCQYWWECPAIFVYAIFGQVYIHFVHDATN